MLSAPDAEGNVGRVFVSYRRADSEADAGRLYQSLRNEFGAESVYKDVDNVPLGSDWRTAVHEAVERSDVMVLVIGPDFVGEDGSSRLDADNDPVRVELEAANDAEVTIIPVLVRDAQMPQADSLPASLEWLSYRNAADLRHASWDRDLQPVVEALERHLGRDEGSAADPDGVHAPEPSDYRDAAPPESDAAAAMGSVDPKTVAAPPPARRASFKLHWMNVAPVLAALTLIAWPIAAALFADQAGGAWLTLLIWAVLCAAAVKQFSARVYELTGDSFVIRQGFLSRSAVAIPFDEVRDITMKQGFVGRRLGFGYVMLRQRGRLTKRKLGMVADAPALQAQLSEAIRRTS